MSALDIGLLALAALFGVAAIFSWIEKLAFAQENIRLRTALDDQAAAVKALRIYVNNVRLAVADETICDRCVMVLRYCWSSR